MTTPPTTYLSTIEETLGVTPEGTCTKHPEIQLCDDANGIKCCEECNKEMEEQSAVTSNRTDKASSESSTNPAALLDSLLSRWVQVQDCEGNGTVDATSALLLRQMLHLENRVQQQENTIQELQKTVSRQQTCIENELKVILKTLEKSLKFGSNHDPRRTTSREKNRSRGRDRDGKEKDKEIVIDDEFTNEVKKGLRANLKKISQFHPSSIFTSVRTLEEEPDEPVSLKNHISRTTSETSERSSATAAPGTPISTGSGSVMSELMREAANAEKDIKFTPPEDEGNSSKNWSVPSDLFDSEQAVNDKPVVPVRRRRSIDIKKQDSPTKIPQRQQSVASTPFERNESANNVQEFSASAPNLGFTMDNPASGRRTTGASAAPSKRIKPRRRHSKSSAMSKEPSMQSVMEDEPTEFGDEDIKSKFNEHSSVPENSSMPDLEPVENTSSNCSSSSSLGTNLVKREIFAKKSGHEVSQLTLDPEIEGLDSDNKTLIKVSKIRLKDKYGEEGTYTGTVGKDDGVPEGKGVMEYDNVRFYDGDWKIGRWHGQGHLVNPNGDVYDGEFVYDARHGHGIYRFKNGDVYDGDFSQDKRHGKGTFIFKNGNVYKGEHVHGKFEGYGRYDFNGGYYEGEWEDGRYEGIGRLQYKDGGNYSGGFVSGVAHGQGEERFPDGTKRTGMWKAGKFQRNKSPPPQRS